MSIQAGIWNFDHESADEQFLDRISEATAQHGPDSKAFYVKGSLGMLYRPFRTTRESCFEYQPYVSWGKNVVTWDGRLDNSEELTSQLDGYLKDDRTDVAIVAAAFDKWGTECFPKLLGDWALAIWNPRERTLILAKDFMGVRHLYYQQTAKRIFWCTTLEPIVLLTDSTWQINDAFIAGYLASYPPANTTPYVGIDSVPPCSFITIKQGHRRIQRYWQFDPSKKIRYRTDAEYEEHFRQVFKEAVRRRLRSSAPILAELSGGMDSSSIVCMADVIGTEGKAETPRLDTMSYYDDEEPNWNERPYFRKVEEQRGRTGVHICAVPRNPFVPLSEEYFIAAPGASQSALLFETEQEAHMRAQGNRVLISGIGGDEVLGGVPTPIPELADLLRQFRLFQFTSKLKAWSLARQQPWTHLLTSSTLNIVRKGMHDDTSLDKLRAISWLDRNLFKTYERSLPHGQVLRTTGCLPSQISFLRTLSWLTDKLAFAPTPLVATREMRYPYVDRSLCEFLFSVPREQILRPMQRRSLMRRSLVAIVPLEILERKRKAFMVRRVMTLFDEARPMLQDVFRNSVSQELHYVNGKIFLQALAATTHGQLVNLIQLNRTIAVELWLRGLAAQRRICKLAVIPERVDTGRVVYSVDHLFPRPSDR